VEIKRSVSNPHPTKGFKQGCEDVKAIRRVVVYPGEERYHLDRQTEVLPLPAILESLGKK